ncbi:MAG: hypothetical protein AB8G26_12255 [Ilumatobacter sp.]
MMSTLERVQALWRDLADAPAAFREPVTIVGSDRLRCAPPGWVGVVTIGAATVVAGPTAELDRLRHLFVDVDPSQFAEPNGIVELVRPKRTLGPTLLFYGDADRVASFACVDGVSGPVSVEDERVVAVLSDATEDERDECGLADGAEGLHLAVDSSGRPAAICGWAKWPHEIAHVGVLAARARRGDGSARRVADAVLTAAQSAQLVPQWRAATTNVASIRLALSLGLTELGSQLSLRL